MAKNMRIQEDADLRRFTRQELLHLEKTLVDLHQRFGAAGIVMERMELYAAVEALQKAQWGLTMAVLEVTLAAGRA